MHSPILYFRVQLALVVAWIEFIESGPTHILITNLQCPDHHYLQLTSVMPLRYH